MATFTWNIDRLECYPQSEGKDNMVFNVYWSCDGSQAVGDAVYTASFNNVCYVPYDPNHVWIEYADLTKDEVFEWLWENGVSQSDTEAAVQVQINNQINPPVVYPALPWG